MSTNETDVSKILMDRLNDDSAIKRIEIDCGIEVYNLAKEYNDLDHQKDEIERKISNASYAIKGTKDRAEKRIREIGDNWNARVTGELTKITLCWLKQFKPAKFEPHIDPYSDKGVVTEKEYILFEDPFFRINARIENTEKAEGYGNRRPKKNRAYSLTLELNSKLSHLLEPLVGSAGLPDGHSYFSYGALIIKSEYFTTTEEAEKYHTRNSKRLAEEYIGAVQKIISEVNAAEDNPDNVFDFRLFVRDALPTYSGSARFEITSRERGHLLIKSPINNAPIKVTRDKFDVIIQGASTKKIKMERYFDGNESEFDQLIYSITRVIPVLRIGNIISINSKNQKNTVI